MFHLLPLSLALAPGFGTAPRGHQPGKTAARANVRIDGTWEGLFRTDEPNASGSSDTRMERHAWQLVQVGPEVKGFYVVELTMVSGDGRPFLCSHTNRFTTLLRYELSGRTDGDGVDLR